LLEGLWEGAGDILGEGLSSMLEQILNATIFKLFYYLESALCWLIGVLMELFEVFAGLEPVTYNGQQQYLINFFFANKAISNIYWGMAIIGMVLIFVFTGWAVIRKMFDIDGKQQQSMGQIIWGAVRSLFLIVGLTLVVNVVISATSILMRQIDYIFNNAYHLDLPQEREFSDEEYAAMGRILATVGNYSMIPNSNNRYNLNLCFNDIRSDMLFLQNQGVFEYSYYDEVDGVVVESWQSVLARIAKSANLNQDVKIDVYNSSVANSITFAMDYLRTSGNPIPVERVEAGYTVTERAHLDRLVFLLGTFRAAKNNQFNERPAFDDPLRGPYYFEEGRSIYEYDQVNEDFDIGFKTDYILVWFSAVALIFNLVIIILNCVARIFNLMLLYIIAPPFIASTPLDNGGKFKQWTTAFIIQSLSVFGTVIAMQLLLLYLPIVASPELVLFKGKPLLNAIAQFMLIFGGVEAAKKAGSLVTGILADQAGMEAIRSGDMSGAANRMISSATNAAKGVAGAAAGVAGFALSPVTNLAKRPFKAAGDFWRKLGSGGRQARAEKAVQEEIAKNKAIEQFKKSGHPDAKYLGGSGGEGPKPQTNTSTTQTNTDNETQLKQPPPTPVPRGKTGGSGRSLDTNDLRPSRSRDPNSSVNKIRNKAEFDDAPQGTAPAREMNATGNRPTLDRPPAAPRENAPAGNRNAPAGNNNNNRDNDNQNNIQNNNQNQPLPQQMNMVAGQGNRQRQNNDQNNNQNNNQIQRQRPRGNSAVSGPRENRQNNNDMNRRQQQGKRGFAPQGNHRGIDRRNRFQDQNQGNRGNNITRQNVDRPPQGQNRPVQPQGQNRQNMDPPQGQNPQGQNPQRPVPPNQDPQYQAPQGNPVQPVMQPPPLRQNNGLPGNRHNNNN